MPNNEPLPPLKKGQVFDPLPFLFVCLCFFFGGLFFLQNPHVLWGGNDPVLMKIFW